MTGAKDKDELPGTVFEFTNPSGKKVWKVELIVGHHPDGRKKTVRRTAHSLREAQRLQLKLADDLEKGLLGDTEMKRMDEFALWWIRDIKARKVRKATAADYEYRYKAHIHPTFGHRQLADIKSKDITDWMNLMEQHPYSKTTINGALQLLRAVFKAAVAHRKAPSNPTDGIESYSIDVRPNVKDPWTRDETLSVLDSCRGAFIELPILLGVHLALRMEEVVGLKWGDLDFGNGTVTINRGVREVGLYDGAGKRHFQMVEELPKSVSSGRTLSLTHDLLSALIVQRERLEIESLYDPEGWVFQTKADWPVRPSRMSKLYREFLLENGHRRIRFHDLRHTSVHLSFEAGVPIEAISQDAGHRDINTTKLIYGRKLPVLSSRRSAAIQEYLNTPEREIPEPQVSKYRTRDGSSSS